MILFTVFLYMIRIIFSPFLHLFVISFPIFLLIFFSISLPVFFILLILFSSLSLFLFFIFIVHIYLLSPYSFFFYSKSWSASSRNSFTSSLSPSLFSFLLQSILPTDKSDCKPTILKMFLKSNILCKPHKAHKKSAYIRYRA